MTLDIKAIKAAFLSDPRVVFVTLFGSAKDETVREGSDVDIGVLLSPEPTSLEFYAFYQQVAAKLDIISELDLIDLSHADSILAFEAVCGKRLLVRDDEKTAEFVSLTARQYEDDMMHAGVFDS